MAVVAQGEPTPFGNARNNCSGQFRRRPPRRKLAKPATYRNRSATKVLKKWLSYRNHSIIARPLSAEEVGHVQQVARRIAAVLLLGPALDASYQNCVLAHG